MYRGSDSESAVVEGYSYSGCNSGWLRITYLSVTVDVTVVCRLQWLQWNGGYSGRKRTHTGAKLDRPQLIPLGLGLGARSGGLLPPAGSGLGRGWIAMYIAPGTGRPRARTRAYARVDVFMN